MNKKENLHEFINKYTNKYIVLDGGDGTIAIIYPDDIRKYMLITDILSECEINHDPHHRSGWDGEWEVQGSYNTFEDVISQYPEILIYSVTEKTLIY